MWHEYKLQGLAFHLWSGNWTTIVCRNKYHQFAQKLHQGDLSLENKAMLVTEENFPFHLFSSRIKYKDKVHEL
jgi:hypothetical protein